MDVEFMKVFLLFDGENYFIGAFSTRDKAQSYLDSSSYSTTFKNYCEIRVSFLDDMLGE